MRSKASSDPLRDSQNCVRKSESQKTESLKTEFGGNLDLHSGVPIPQGLGASGLLCVRDMLLKCRGKIGISI